MGCWLLGGLLVVLDADSDREALEFVE